ncbi:MAG: M3 family metallopeptidase [Candidatus Cloacimonetes bacterium]|jgi:Zn-dependent oligopeptidase|nr:M3 family metallopeptidase [Candidatus Cloacimonadota bacterium]MCB5278887.1 M3 family metallopeptidase [Candidatus Cloacimonadota bacterium]MDY0299433.1 M3 family metallopeptidase [Candidatus Cloacimonadaceae bacterium]
MQDNPLLRKENDHRLKAIPFDEIKLEHFMPAFEEGLRIAKADIEAIKNNPEQPTFENTILAMDMSGVELDYASTVYFNLLGAHSNAEFKALAQKISPMLAEFSSSIATDPKIFERVKAVYEQEVAGKSQPNLPSDIDDKETMRKAERYRLIERSYKSFIRGGALLNDADKKRFTEIAMELSKLSPKFSDNVLNATNAFELHITDPKDLEGMPQGALDAAEYTAKKKGKDGGWLFTLQPSSVMPLLTYCKNREIRRKISLAYSSRAFRDDFDNQENIKRTLLLRKERAKILGYQNHADYVLEDRMAASVDNARSFLDQIYEVAYPAAQKERDEVAKFAKELDGIEELMGWDWGYYSNKLKEKLFAYDPEELRPWFKVENVIDGLFTVTQKIYGITMKQVYDVPVYHEDVTTWEAHDADGSYLGLLYIDIFPRETKRGGAWKSSLQGQGLHHDGMRRPQVMIVGSLTPSTDKSPSLLRLDEARTIFHEFGHALHSLLADGYYKSLSGTSVLWDFVELPSQIMENWLLEKEALNLFARHYETGEPLPIELLDKVIAAKNFNAGYANVGQLRYANLDFDWHLTDPTKINDINEFEREHTERFTLLPPVEGTNTSCAFAHIFAGGYAAGYYSYKWAEALEADAWSMFVENGIFDQNTAQKFRKYILSRGNAFHPQELFEAFRGRPLDPEALLKRDGLI